MTMTAEMYQPEMYRLEMYQAEMNQADEHPGEHRADAHQPASLVIDDDSDILGLVRCRLLQAGFEVWTACNGDTGLATALDIHPDVMVVDWLLPGRSGLEICAAVRGDLFLHDIPVLMLTARDQEADREWGYAVGVDDYIVKPPTGGDRSGGCQALERRSPGGHATTRRRRPPPS
jgi:DNA-binding response OmpR family regulator